MNDVQKAAKAAKAAKDDAKPSEKPAEEEVVPETLEVTAYENSLAADADQGAATEDGGRDLMAELLQAEEDAAAAEFMRTEGEQDKAPADADKGKDPQADDKGKGPQADDKGKGKAPARSVVPHVPKKLQPGEGSSSGGRARTLPTARVSEAVMAVLRGGVRKAPPKRRAQVGVSSWHKTPASLKRNEKRRKEAQRKRFVVVRDGRRMSLRYTKLSDSQQVQQDQKWAKTLAWFENLAAGLAEAKERAKGTPEYKEKAKEWTENNFNHDAFIFGTNFSRGGVANLTSQNHKDMHEEYLHLRSKPEWKALDEEPETP